MVQVLTMSAESPALYPPRPSFFPSHRVPWAWNEKTVETFEETKQISSPVPINYVGEHRKPEHGTWDQCSRSFLSHNVD